MDGSTVVYLSSFEWPDPPGESALIHTAKTEIEKLGYAFSVLRTCEYKSSAALARVLKNRGVAGLIVGSIRTLDCPVIKAMDWSGFPAVACGGGYYNPPIPTFSFHFHQGVLLAWEQAIAHGYRRIAAALYSEPTPSDDDIMRYGAATWALDKMVHPNNRIPPWCGSLYEPEKAIPWLKKYRPDAVLTYHPGIYHRFLNNNAVDASTGFVFFHLENEPGTIYSGSVRDNQRRMQLLAKQLDLYIRHNIKAADGPPVSTLMQMSWYEGSTLPKKRPNKTPANQK